MLIEISNNLRVECCPEDLATPIRFDGRVLQYKGRVLRPAPGKDRALVYDYLDKHVRPLVASFRARQQVYYRG